MNAVTVIYVLYYAISISVIHLMARTLAKSSSTFLLEAFSGKNDLVLLLDRVVIGSFFLANVGFVVVNAPYTYLDNVPLRHAIATLLEKLGAAMLFMGFTLFLGLWIFARLRSLGAPAANGPMTGRVETL